VYLYISFWLLKFVPLFKRGPGAGWLSPLADQLLSFHPPKKETGKAAWHAEK
jgi:hypothetical protein